MVLIGTTVAILNSNFVTARKLPHLKNKAAARDSADAVYLEHHERETVSAKQTRPTTIEHAHPSIHESSDYLTEHETGKKEPSVSFSCNQ